MSRRFLAQPTTRAGRWSGIAALGAMVALVIANTLFADASGALETMRVASMLVFLGGGVAALLLSVRSLRQGERSIVVWVSLAIGALAAALIVAELAIME